MGSKRQGDAFDEETNLISKGQFEKKQTKYISGFISVFTFLGCHWLRPGGHVFCL